MDTTEETKWNNYQLLVLQQLEDHGELLKNLNREICSIKETIASLQTNVTLLNANTAEQLIKEQISKIENITSNLKDSYTVDHAQFSMWKNQTEERLEVIEDDIQYVFYDENGAERRLQAVERNYDVQQHLRSASKAQWALYISIIISVLNIVAHLVSPLIKR